MSDELPAALAHALLSCVCAPRIHEVHIKNFACLGMHVNLFVHGILGILNFQKTAIGKDVSEAYKISLAASKYLPLASALADMRRGNEMVAALHGLSGIIPFAMAVTGNESAEGLGRLSIICNILAAMYYALDRNNKWGWFTSAAAIVAYFGAPGAGEQGKNAVYPLALAALEYCAYKMGNLVDIVLK